MRKGQWKLLRNKAGLELYRLDTDLSETRNLASENPEIVEELLASYEGWREGIVPRIRRRR